MMEFTIRMGDSKRILSDKSLEHLDIIQVDSEWHLVQDTVGYSVQDIRCDPDLGHVSLRVNGKLFEMSITDEIQEQVAALGIGSSEDEKPKLLEAPMPGLALEVLVEKGEEIEEGQPLVVLQAMKMENLLKASFPLRIGDILVKPGQKVEKGATLILFDLDGK